MNPTGCRNDYGVASPFEPPHVSAAGPQPWELVDVGRYMPRRIRGSLLGRELG
jgi:hypothetical protein